jgi:hypothetical protein
MGSGVKAYVVYYSEDGVQYEPWLTDTTATSAEFTGNYGMTYSFYSIATDYVGHVETVPDSADKVVTVIPGEGDLVGTVMADSAIGLYGVVIDVHDAGGVLVSSLATDSGGTFEIPDLQAGDYSVSATTPLGYQTDQETKEISISHGVNEVRFDFRTLSIIPQQRSRAYWAHQLGRALRGKPKDYSMPAFSSLAFEISEHFNNNPVNPVMNYVVPDGAGQLDSLEILKALLTFRHVEADEPFLKRIARGQLVALMLNVVSQKVSQQEVITRDSMTVSQAITYCDLLVNDLDCPLFEPPEWFLAGYAQMTDCQRYMAASFVAGLVNVGVILPEGVIPQNIRSIAYKYWESSNVPTRYSLAQNYPNPFNPVTTIKYSLPERSRVILDVFNILGQKVLSLVDREEPAGTYTVTWDGSDAAGNSVATGVYLYRLRAGDYVETKKMLLLK